MMARNTRFKVAFCVLVLSLLSPSASLSKAPVSAPSSLPPNLDPSTGATLDNATAARSNGQSAPVLLTFIVRFMDEQPVPAALAQLVSDAGTSQNNITLSDGSCSFKIDPAQSYNLSLSALGSRLSGGPIKLRDPVTIVPSTLHIQDGLCDFGAITIAFTSFCAGTSIIGSGREGVAAGSSNINAPQTLQVPNQSCTWILGPFDNSASVELSIQSLDLTTGDSLTIYGLKQDGRPQFSVLQIGGPRASNGFMSYPRVVVPAPQAIIVFNSGPGPDALSYGFQMYYQADRPPTTGQILTLSLVWVGGGLVILLAVLVLVWILHRRHRQLARERESTFLSWDRLQANTSAEPDVTDPDVMLVKLPGHEPHRLALPQLAWKELDPGTTESRANGAADPKEGSERAVSPDTSTSEPLGVLKPLCPEKPEDGRQGNSFLQLAEAGHGRREQAALEESREDSESCAICLDKYELGVMLRPLPCKHAFHTACIDTWLKKDPSCPLCKRPLYRPPSKSKGCLDSGERPNEDESESAQAPSSTGAENGQIGTATDLEAGEDRQTQNEVRLDEGSLNEAYERAERQRQANRQRPPNPAWYLHQWLGWGW